MSGAAPVIAHPSTSISVACACVWRRKQPRMAMCRVQLPPALQGQIPWAVEPMASSGGRPVKSPTRAGARAGSKCRGTGARGLGEAPLWLLAPTLLVGIVAFELNVSHPVAGA